jgi:hypothetical protein
MTDNGTLRDHLADVINERNELLRKVELLEARLDVLTQQLSALWKVDNPSTDKGWFSNDEKLCDD